MSLFLVDVQQGPLEFSEQGRLGLQVLLVEAQVEGQEHRTACCLAQGLVQGVYELFLGLFLGAEQAGGQGQRVLGGRQVLRTWSAWPGPGGAGESLFRTRARSRSGRDGAPARPP